MDKNNFIVKDSCSKIITADDTHKDPFSIWKLSNSDVIIGSKTKLGPFQQINLDNAILKIGNEVKIGAYCTISAIGKPLFSWDEIPGNDNDKLIEFLKQKFEIDWVKTAEIEKIDNGNTIKVTTEINHLSLNLNQEKTEIIFKIDDDRIDKFMAKMENGKLNIYGKKLIINIGDNVKIDDYCNFQCFADLEIGNDCHLWSGVCIAPFENRFFFEERVTLGQNVVVGGRGPIIVKKYSMIGGLSAIITESHHYKELHELVREQNFEKKGIFIGTDVWIGASVIVLDGSIINDKSVIGASSLVKGETEKGGTYFGIPIKKYGERTSEGDKN